MARRVDCDVHVAAPSAAVFLPYLPDYWREFLEPRAQAGAQATHVQYTYPEWSTMLATRGADISIERVRQEVLAHSDLAVLTCYAGLESMTHPYYAAALGTAVNTWIQAEWLDRDPCLLGAAAIPPQFAELAVEEIDRVAADPRFVQLLLPARSWEPYGHQRYWPIWEAAARHGLAVAISLGGATGAAPTSVGWMSSFYEHYVAAIVQFEAHMTSLVVSGIFQRFPDLRIVVAESGWTWLPPLMWRMDTEWKAARREVPWVEEPPSSYVRRHFRFTIQPTDAPPAPADLLRVYEQLGSDELLLFSSDYPHRYADGPAELLELLSPEQRERLLWRNAWECFDLDRRLAAAAKMS
jgi:predicted TIM-barrel fold metal-dependent hydrolase